MSSSFDREELKRLHILRRVDLDTAMKLLAGCRVRELDPGDVLLAAGQSNQTMFMTLSGRLGVHLESVERPPIAFIEAGQTVGEISVIDDSAASAFVVAASRSRLLAVGEDAFWALVRGSHEFAQNMLLLLVQRLRASTTTIGTTDRLRRQFEHEAQVDGLTGIHNRRWFDQAMPRLVERCRREDAPLSLLVLDVDFFKRFNDDHGHAAGDAVLIEVARALGEGLRATDVAARIGGEEFVCVLPSAGREQARAVAERLREGIGRLEISLDGRKLPRVTASFGLAELEAGDDVASLLGRADACLYRAKGNGRNRVEG